MKLDVMNDHHRCNIAFTRRPSYQNLSIPQGFQTDQLIIHLKSSHFFSDFSQEFGRAELAPMVSPSHVDALFCHLLQSGHKLAGCFSGRKRFTDGEPAYI